MGGTKEVSLHQGATKSSPGSRFPRSHRSSLCSNGPPSLFGLLGDFPPACRVKFIATHKANVGWCPYQPELLLVADIRTFSSEVWKKGARMAPAIFGGDDLPGNPRQNRWHLPQKQASLPELCLEGITAHTTSPPPPYLRRATTENPSFAEREPSSTRRQR